MLINKNEKLNFLENFEKRMIKLSYTYLIDYQVDKKSVIFEKYNVDRQDIINIVYSTLCFIMDKTLKDEDCLMEDIVMFLDLILKQYYELNLSNEDVKEIARYIIVKILRNDGKQFKFKIKNYNKNTTEFVNYYLIKSQPSLLDKSISSYKLTEEGYKLLLNTYETDQRLQVELQSIILTESIKRRNFKNGIATIRQMDNIIRVQIDNVKDMIKQIRENIFEINKESFSKMYLDNISIINDQKEQLLKIERLILKSQEDINVIDKNGILAEENVEALSDLNEIKTYVDRLIAQSTKMVDYHFDFKKEYFEALKTISLNFNTNHLSFSKNYLQPIEENVLVLENFNKIIQPIISPKVNKHINYNKIIEELKILQEEKNDDAVSIDNIEMDEEKEDNLNKEMKRVYKKSLSIFLEKIKQEINTKRVNDDYFTLYELLKNANDEEYNQIIPTIRIFTEIIVQLLRIGTINFDEIYEKNKDKFFDMSSKFDIVETLYELIIEKELLNLNVEISFLKLKQKIEIDEKIDNEAIVSYKAIMNDIKIDIKKTT